ncbi:hypothetical protein VPBB_1931 [Vibrio parahaemolyticus BB22OP]|nr:hypothetical protein VPBB_1931 [Vibrio parahaemolyticus BB22OP]
MQVEICFQRDPFVHLFSKFSFDTLGIDSEKVKASLALSSL